MEQHEECVNEFKTFASGGPAALYRLKQVLTSLFGYYNLQTRGEQADALRKAGLQPVETSTGVSFALEEPQSEAGGL